MIRLSCSVGLHGVSQCIWNIIIVFGSGANPLKYVF